MAHKFIASLILSALCLSGVSYAAGENDWFVPLGQPPQAPPKNISGGEAFPPLPLPATPLRRTERKRNPTPPSLFGKVVWGEQGSFTYQEGGTAKIADWNLCPADLKQLFTKVRNRLGLEYGYDEVSLSSFDGDPEKLAVLFFSGTRTLKLDDKALAQLRAYVLKGGMLVFDSVAGSPFFYDSVKVAMQKAFPEIQWRVLPGDHPIFHMVGDVKSVGYSSNVKSNQPFFEGMYIGSRVAVLLSKYGMGCGWDNRPVPYLKQAAFMDVPSSELMGLNIVTYAIGYHRIGQEESRPEMFAAIDEKTPTDEFVFAQIQHEGAFNVHPNNAVSLLTRLRTGSGLRVNLKRMVVNPAKDDLSNVSFLYLTGLDDFKFNDQAATAIRNFLQRNGTLLINNGLGLSSFDSAVRRELVKVLPNAKLEAIPANHPIFSAVAKIQQASYAPAVTMKYGAINSPKLEGISINGDLRVIYSPIDLEAGWIESEYPMAQVYKSETALPLGMNILVYAATH